MIIDSPIISGSYLSTGSLSQTGNVSITGSLTVTDGITGSIQNAVTASYALTASYLTGYVSPFPFTGSAQITGSLGVTGSINSTGNITTTGTITAQTLVVQTVTSSIVYSSGSNIFGSQLTNTQTFTGSVNITGSAVNLKDGIFSGSGANLFGIPATGITGLNLSQIASGSASASISPNNGLVVNTNTKISGSTQITGSLGVTGSFSVSGSAGTVFSSNADTLLISGSLLVTGSAQITGSLSVSGSITASLFGTASQATSASYSYTASSAINASASLIATSASYAFTASSAISASYSQTASYLLGYISPFPYTGSAAITGSLIITGSLAVSTLVTSSGVRYVIADQNGLISAQTASAAIFTTQQNIASAGQTVFPITNGYVTDYLTVFVNGTKLANDEFTDTDGVNVTFLTGSTAGDTVEFVKYMPASGVSNNVLRTVNYFTASLGQTNFTVNYTPGLLDVFYNGAKLDNTEYTAANGTSITLATGSNAGDTLEVDVYSYQVGAFSGIGGVGVANQIAYYNTTNSITGSRNFTVSGSAIIITGSLTVSGSGTFTNIGPAVFSGSVTAVGGFSGSFSGNADSASLAQNSLLLQGTGSVGFATTASLLTVSSSQQQISASQQQISASYIALSASYNVYSSSVSTRTTQVEKTYATTGSNTFTGVQNFSNTCTPNGFNSGASLYTAGGLQVTQDTYFSSSVYIKGNVTVYGTQSVSYVSSSQFNIGTNIITVNTFTPSVRFGGLSVFDSGSTGLTGSIFWDSELNRWIYTNASGSGGGATYGGGMFISGPRNTQGLGCEQGTTACMLLVGQGGDHLTSSMIYHDSARTCVPNTLIGSTICTTMVNASCTGIGTTTLSSSLHVATGPNADGIFLGRIAACTNKHAIFLSADQCTGAYIAGGTNPDGTATQADGVGRIILQGSQTEGLQFQTSCVAGGAAQSWNTRFKICNNGAAYFTCELTAKTLGTNDLMLNNLNYECANYVDGTRGSWLIQEGACDLFIINQISCKKYKFNLIEIK